MLKSHGAFQVTWVVMVITRGSLTMSRDFCVKVAFTIYIVDESLGYFRIPQVEKMINV